MKRDDLLKIVYSASIYAKDVKVGMKLVDSETPESECFVFEVTDVKVTEDNVQIKEETYDEKGETLYSVNLTLDRKPQEPLITVFFSSIEEAVQFGIDERDVEES